MRMPRLKSGDAVEVKWLDAHGGDLCWEKLDLKHLVLEPIITIGRYEAHTEEALVLTLSRDERGHVDCYLTVPLVNVKSVRKLA